MINFDDYANEYKTENNQDLSSTADHSYRILIIGGSGSGTSALLNLINNQPDIDKIDLFVLMIHMKLNINF